MGNHESYESYESECRGQRTDYGGAFVSSDSWFLPVVGGGLAAWASIIVSR